MAGSNTGRNLQLVIVALPTVYDPVREISSEKEPHLTLLYLGNVNFNDDQLKHVTEYVQHASSLLNQFSLDVQSRGLLGDKNADVIFFNTTWSKQIESFRTQLLKDPLISTAFQSAEQFEGWTPHLTLGFPESPAKKKPNDYPRGWESVTFDRIALWTGEYSGPTFTLKPYSSEGAMAMSQIRSATPTVTVEGLLAHHGVKGMKWGVRRSDPPGDSRSNPGPPVPRASADSAAATNAANKAKAAGGLHALSNQELQHLVNRMNLERQYSTMQTQHKNEIDKGLETTKKILKVGKTVEEIRKFMETPTGQAVKVGLAGAFAAAKFAASVKTGGASKGAEVAVRVAANHFTNVGR